jgi:hypothetical protein
MEDTVLPVGMEYPPVPLACPQECKPTSNPHVQMLSSAIPIGMCATHAASASPTDKRVCQARSTCIRQHITSGLIIKMPNNTSTWGIHALPALGTDAVPDQYVMVRGSK